jgi:glutaminyl-peptide cyclotransferase
VLIDVVLVHRRPSACSIPAAAAGAKRPRPAAAARVSCGKGKEAVMSSRWSARRWGWLGTVGALGLALGAISCQPSSNGDDKDEPDQYTAAAAGGEKPVAFDGERAMEYLEAVCKIGPRISGTAGMKKQQQLIEKHFKKLGAKVVYQKFTARQKSLGRPVEMANLIVSYYPEKKRRVILCSHYDTRPIADQEDDERRWHRPFVSANDGGSGVAFLMEMAHHMKGLKTNVGVDFVLFDGEEYIFDPRRDQYFFGSEHFAAQYKRARNAPKYTAAILLDMIAGKNARFPHERNSVYYASKLVKEVWGIAKEQKCDAFKHEAKHEVLDDHIALNKANIPAIDIIDFDYEHWHKLTDVPKNCSAEPMEQVAKVLSVWLQRTK